MSEHMTAAEIADLAVRRVNRDGRVEVLCSKAHTEIKRLQAALRLATGCISATPRFSDQHPETVLKWIEDEAAGLSGAGDPPKAGQ
jgi:hypothetical protein